MNDFNAYYQFYLNKHQNVRCRRMHVLGNVATIAFMVVALCGYSWWWLLLTPFIVYPFAVAGHLFEGEMPAFFSSNPLYAKAADLRMMWDTLTGKLPL